MFDWWNENKFRTLFLLVGGGLAVIALRKEQKKKIINLWEKKDLRKDFLRTVFLWFLTNFFSSLIFHLSARFFLGGSGRIEMPVNQKLIEEELLSRGPFSLTFQILIVAPIVEELVFRWLVFEIFGQQFFSTVISALFFGLAHWHGEFNFRWLTYISSGFIIALVYYVSNFNLIYPIAFHFIINLIAFFFMLVRVYEYF